MKQLSVVVENKPGILANVALLLGNAGINIESITAEPFPGTEKGVVRVITRDAESAKSVLRRGGFAAGETSVLVVSMHDKPGQLGRVATRLAGAGVNVENLYLLSKKGGESVFAMKVDNEAKAREVLGKDHVLEKY